MIRLFSEPYEVYTDWGRELDALVVEAFKPILEVCVEKNISLRDLDQLATTVLSQEISCAILMRNTKTSLKKKGL